MPAGQPGGDIHGCLLDTCCRPVPLLLLRFPCCHAPVSRPNAHAPPLVRSSASRRFGFPQYAGTMIGTHAVIVKECASCPSGATGEAWLRGGPVEELGRGRQASPGSQDSCCQLRSWALCTVQADGPP